MAQPTLTGARGGSFVAYRWALLVFLVLGVVQIFLAGLGVFALHGQEIGSSGETAFGPHRVVGNIMSAVALVILILALIARASRLQVIGPIVLFVLAAGAQSLFAALGQDASFFGGLHALDGVAVVGLAGFLHATTVRQSKAARSS
jgi:hypothetical protein